LNQIQFVSILINLLNLFQTGFLLFKSNSKEEIHLPAVLLGTCGAGAGGGATLPAVTSMRWRVAHGEGKPIGVGWDVRRSRSGIGCGGVDQDARSHLGIGCQRGADHGEGDPAGRRQRWRHGHVATVACERWCVCVCVCERARARMCECVCTCNVTLCTWARVG
jgi:hypothetical protein